jgi:hypothetical protein
MLDRSPSKPLPGLRAQPATAGRVLERVQEALRGLRYGEVTVIVQDGVIVQVERTDRLRLPRERR